ncbi:hypothetical protein FLBR109950_15760 [Flavobacterium branchiophilum]
MALIPKEMALVIKNDLGLQRKPLGDLPLAYMRVPLIIQQQPAPPLFLKK